MEGRARETLGAIRPLAGQSRHLRTGSLAAAVFGQVASRLQGGRTNPGFATDLCWHPLILQRANLLVRPAAEQLARGSRKRSFLRFSVRFDNTSDLLQNRLHAPAPFYHV